jgi:hypothetical protein
MHHKMTPAQLEEALAATPDLILKKGIQFHDGQRIVSIPAAFCYEISEGVAIALRDMLADKRRSEPAKT